jgi:predicted PurR-regulated permease PerM
MPLSLSVLLSILLFPISKFLETKFRMDRNLANFIVIILVLAFLSGLVYLFFEQMLIFRSSVDELKENISQKLFNIQLFIKETTGMRPKAQMQWLNERFDIILGDSAVYVSQTIINMTSILATFGIMLFYIFFMILYREKFFEFFKQVIPNSNHETMNIIIYNTKNVVQQYISGVFIVVIIMAVMVTSGLLLLGIPFAIFLGILTALINIVPYVGILSGAILATIITFITKDNTWYVTGTIGVYFLSHFFETNYFTPKIVGSKVGIFSGCFEGWLLGCLEVGCRDG